VLYDAVVLMTCPEHVGRMAEDPAVRDFVADAFAHCKFIGFIPGSEPLFVAAGIADRIDAAVISLDDDTEVRRFVEQCRALRFWERELNTVTVG
jgi:catalase